MEPTSLSAMAEVQLEKTEISPVVRAMTQALCEQGHLVRIEKGMPRWGFQAQCTGVCHPQIRYQMFLHHEL